jgi:DMSO reductase family type II enzyme molybdopterin subunit
MSGLHANRRQFLSGGGALAASLSLKYSIPAAQAQNTLEQAYGAWEDVMRKKWTWDKVVHGSRGINCTGHCAFNIYVKDGIVWREEQQGEYGRSGEDTPDYGPRGCQKGIRQAKYMYSKGRVLYPMKRAGERGEGRWERISWDQAATEIADRFIDYATEFGPTSITLAMGTAMILKRAGFASLFRFANLTGVVVPETFAGVGDLPVGAYQVLGYELPGDNMAAVFKSKVCLVWVCNPAATRIPDAHFFWEARYNGTEVVTITPDFNASAMHSSKWLNPKPGTDTALAMAMVQVIIEEGAIEWDYVREQTDLPFLVRKDNRKFLRTSDFTGNSGDGEPGFYYWDEATNALVQVPATGFGSPIPGQEAPESVSIALGAVRPMLEGSWSVDTKDGQVEVTTVFELTKELAQGYAPERAAGTTGIHADVIRDVARTFATAKPGMIFAGYRANKWVHGDGLLRAWLLMCALTGNTGREGGGIQTTQLPSADGLMGYAFNGMGPRLNVQAISLWDYVHSEGAKTTRKIYGDAIADHFESHHEQAVENHWIPDFSQVPWKMGFMVGHNPANWRATGEGWRDTAFGKLETIVTATPHMSVTAMHSDYVLPIADHYERDDFTMEGRTPYAQVISEAVPPLGESVDDWTMLERVSRAISERAKARGIAPVKGFAFGQPVEWDYAQFNDIFTTLQNGDGSTTKIQSTADAADFIIKNSMGMSKATSFKALKEKGFIRVDDSDGVQFGKDSNYSYYVLARVKDKRPYETLTGRQQFYIDHDWFLQEGEALPEYKEPFSIKGFDLRLTMGHARHGIHSMYRDDTLLVSLQRGEPDIYLNPDDAKQRGVTDGEMVRVFNSYGSFIAQGHVSAGVQPKTLFMYHGWDPMMFKGQENFSSVISTNGLIKPTALIGGYGHLNYRPPGNVPNQTFHDCTVEFEKYTDA